MKLLITGSSGMVGKNITEVAARYPQHIILCPDRGELDLSNVSEIDNYIVSSKPDLVVHCAGLVGGIHFNKYNQYKFLTENLRIGMNLVDCLKENRVERLINLSSSCVYPDRFLTPIKEEALFTGQFEETNEGYAIAKSTIMKMCEYVTKESEQLFFKNIVPCNLYGRFDNFDPDRSHMLPSAIRKVLNAQRKQLETVEIWGNGKARREFMYAGDFAEFIFFAIENFDALPTSMNVGLGEDRTITEYYETIKNVVGYEGAFVYDESKPNGIERKLVDNTKQRDLGWKSTTSLEDGIQKAIHFYLHTYGNEYL